VKDPTAPRMTHLRRPNGRWTMCGNGTSMTMNLDRVTCLSCLKYAPRPLLEAPRLYLSCPACGTRHVDEGAWALRHHKTHHCTACGHEWTPCPYPTFGAAP
jgi:predicted RNA-binding Zn-ribbon protein involved in translation (DUF1610 family)